jgi:hypothetical protein
MAPDIGGPARAPSEKMLMNIPSRRPTSFVSPKDIIGFERSETYDPEESLRIVINIV